MLNFSLYLSIFRVMNWHPSNFSWSMMNFVCIFVFVTPTSFIVLMAFVLNEVKFT